MQAKSRKRPGQTITLPPTHKSRIMDAASRLFLEQGFDSTSTADIARRAKVSKRELYGHFSNKTAILTEVIRSLQSHIWADMDVEWSSTGDLRSTLLHAGRAIAQRVASEAFQNLFRIVAAESFQVPEAAREFYQLGPLAGRKQTARFFRKQMNAGSMPKANALEAADHFLDLVISGRFITGLALGQKQKAMATRVHVEHAVALFLARYKPAQLKK
jgi:AcrR family transcriptional regulator